MGGKQYQVITFTSYETKAVTEEKLRAVGATWWLYGVETCPDTGRVHLQGMAYSPVKRSWLRLMRPIHIEQCRDALKSIDYCKKGDQPHEEWDTQGKDGPNYGRNADVTEHGERPTFNIAGERKKLTNAQLLGGNLEELVENELLSLYQYPKVKEARSLFNLHKRKNVPPQGQHLWIYGPPRSGKSYAVYNKYKENIFMKQMNKWWDGYDGEKVVLLDDFDKGGKALGHHLKLWADYTLPVKGEIKRSTIPCFYDIFIVTSNYTIEEIFDDDPTLCAALKERFKVWHKATRQHDILFDEI